MHFKSGEVSVSKEDMNRFVAQFDPQPFHLDEAAAEKTAFKGLAAPISAGAPAYPPRVSQNQVYVLMM